MKSCRDKILLRKTEIKLGGFFQVSYEESSLFSGFLLNAYIKVHIILRRRYIVFICLIHQLFCSDAKWQRAGKPGFDYQVVKQLVKREAEN